MKRPPITFVKPSKGDLDYAALRLRYMNPENVAKDFPSKRERAAIAAVFEWLSYNSLTAWQLKNGTYTVVAMTRTSRSSPHAHPGCPALAGNPCRSSRGASRSRSRAAEGETAAPDP